MSASGKFFHARQSSELLPERLVLKPSRPKRGALSERSASQINTENGDHPTIRLVDPDSSSPSVYDKTPFPRIPAQVLKPSKSTKHGYTVQNDVGFPSLDARLRERSSSPKRSSKLLPQSLNLQNSNRMSAATTISNADTLFNDSLYSPTSNRFSTDGTLRNTPTPQEMEERERDRERIEALEALEEEAPESTTIRPVTASSTSTERPVHSRDPNFLLAQHPAFRQQAPTPPRHGRLSSIESVDTPVSAGLSSESPVEGPSSEYSSQESSSSPNAGRSDSYNIIQYATSEDNMSVQYAQVRPATAHSQSAASDWSNSGADSLPPLSIARKRMHADTASTRPQMPHGRPLSTIASVSEPSSRSQTRSRFSHGSVDMLRSTQRPSQQLRHGRSKTLGSSTYSSLSSGSNFETIRSDDSQIDVTQYSMMRAQSAMPTPLFSSSPNLPVYKPQGDSASRDMDGEQDDTIAELQARPVLRGKRSGHLSRGRSTSDPPPGSYRPNQPATENDRTSQGSSIFPSWAKQFYRGRTQLGSANASKISLARSDSQAFSSRSPVRMMPWAHHRRFESGWESYNTTDQSVFSDRPDTSRSGFSGYSHSPASSSHFLPSIFRPYTRRRAYTDITAGSHSQPSEDFYDESSSSDSGDRGSVVHHRERSSLEITAAPPRPSDDHAVHHPSPLGSSPNRKQRSQRERRRERQRQRQADLPHDPTSGSSQRYASTSLSATQIYNTPPHLAPSRRFSNRISAWRAPSFDEALNTLVVSRQNRQILFFCLGFLCPLLWMVAAFLPIPPRPRAIQVNEFVGEEEEPKTGQGRFSLGVQMEMFDWEQEKRHLKARWWRNLNRVMSFVGVGVVAAIVSCELWIMLWEKGFVY